MLRLSVLAKKEFCKVFESAMKVTTLFIILIRCLPRNLANSTWSVNHYNSEPFHKEVSLSWLRLLLYGTDVAIREGLLTGTSILGAGKARTENWFCISAGVIDPNNVAQRSRDMNVLDVWWMYFGLIERLSEDLFSVRSTQILDGSARTGD